MPETFKTLNAETGELEDIPYYTAEEVAELLHCSISYVRNQVRLGRWPYVAIARRLWFTPSHYARIVEILSYDPDLIGPPPRRLGTPVDPQGEEPIQ